MLAKLREKLQGTSRKVGGVKRVGGLLIVLALSLCLLFNLKISTYTSEIDNYKGQITQLKEEIQKVEKRLQSYRKVNRHINTVSKEKLVDRIGHFASVKFTTSQKIEEQVTKEKGAGGIALVTINPAQGIPWITSRDVILTLEWFKKEFGEFEVALVSVFPFVIAVSIAAD